MNERIYENVTLGRNASVGDYVIIGVPASGRRAGELPTVVGDNAVIRSHTVIYAGTVIGDDLQTGHGTLIREDNRIGNAVSIGSHSVIEHHVIIGSRVRIHSQAFVPEYSILHDDCWIGPNVVFTNAAYPRSLLVKEALQGPTIHSGAKIGANATILPGIVVGRDALVGAGAVVVRDVPAGKVVVGNPARVVRDIGEIEAYRTLSADNLGEDTSQR